MKKVFSKVLFMALGMVVFTACADDSGSGGSGTTEKLETEFTRITVSSKDLGDVAVGDVKNFTITYENKSSTEPMLLTVLESTDIADSTSVTSTCPDDPSAGDNDLIQPAGESCTDTYEFTMGKEGYYFPTPMIWNMQDRNGELLSVVLPYTIVQ